MLQIPKAQEMPLLFRWVEYSFCLFHYCVSPCTWLWHHTNTRALYLQLGVVMNIQKGILNYKIETFSPCISGILQNILSKKKLEFDKNLTSGKQVYKYIERKKHLIISFYYKIDIYIKKKHSSQRQRYLFLSKFSIDYDFNPEKLNISISVEAFLLYGY